MPATPSSASTASPASGRAPSYLPSQLLRGGRQVASYAAGVTVPVADLTADLRTLIGS